VNTTVYGCRSNALRPSDDTDELGAFSRCAFLLSMVVSGEMLQGRYLPVGTWGEHRLKSRICSKEVLSLQSVTGGRA
jgi:hypothetical protein